MTEQPDPDTTGQNVVYLPDRRAGGEQPGAVERAGEVLDAELVDPADNPAIDARLRAQRFREASAQRAVVLVHRVQESERPARIGKALVRHALYVPAGLGVTVRTWRDSHGSSRYERQMRAAEAAGDQEALRYWHEAEVAERERRHRRVMEWLAAPGQLVKAAAVGVASLAGLLLALGLVLAVANDDAALVLEPLGTLIDAVVWLWWLVTAYGTLLVTGAIGLGVLYLWDQGRKHSTWTPRWVQPSTAREHEVVNITPSSIVTALRDLGIAPLRKWIQADPDVGARMLGPITRYGPGAQVEITLPPQVTVHHIMRVRETLAGNLDRKAHEVYVESSPDSERQFTLWVADSGALDRPVPPSPLLDESFGPVDIYRDTMPWGVSPKGDPVELNLLQQHFLLAGLSKQGKTAAARALILWLALDPSVRFWIADLKGFGDWSMFEGLADTLVEGAGAENFIATCDMLEAAVAEMQRRYEAWRAMGKKGDIDRKSSQPGSGFEPLIVVVDEVQKLYTCTTEHPDGGDIGGNGKKSRAARAAQALHDQARAVNIHLFQFAQNPTDANLPAVVREGAMIRASLFVGTESIAKMALGEAPVDTGAAPHALRAGLDRGTVVLAPGESMDLPGGATHTTVRTHYISTEQAYDVAERAKALRGELTTRGQIEQERRDLLADVAEVLRGEDRVKATDVAARLRKHAQHYGPYKTLDGKQLAAELEALGVRVTHKDGYLQVYLQRVQEARAARESE